MGACSQTYAMPWSDIAKFAVAKFRGLSYQDAADIQQDTIQHLLEMQDRIMVANDPKAYAFQIAYNFVCGYFRGKSSAGETVQFVEGAYSESWKGAF